MTLQLLHSEFPYIWGNLIFFFISVCLRLQELLLLSKPCDQKSWSLGWSQRTVRASAPPWRYTDKINLESVLKESHARGPFIGISSITTLLRANVKKFSDFSIPSCDVMHLQNSPWPGIIKLFPARECLVSDIAAGDGKIANLFLQCIHNLDLPQRRRKTKREGRKVVILAALSDEGFRVIFNRGFRALVSFNTLEKGYRFSRLQPGCH